MAWTTAALTNCIPACSASERESEGEPYIDKPNLEEQNLREPQLEETHLEEI